MSADRDYTSHWDEKFRSRDWGRWPIDDLVRFIGRNFKNIDRSKLKVLEVGCGPGANLWFLHREGFNVAGIDVSPAAIEITAARLSQENRGINDLPADLRVGNFGALPWADNYFDAVVDIVALYSNTTEVIKKSLAEIARVLKPGGVFYSKVWGTNTTGYGTGNKLEASTFDAIPFGPFKDMGVAHFFTKDEIEKIYGQFFVPVAIDVISRSDVSANQHFEEFHCQFKKAA